ncbi:FkbM family methyltransferase [Acidithiobacillus ferrooxidans]|uniref:FkbM family methyltransferase n=1 Tax=Acidithiobacillus ferrooxidans TaxID=920 RepID=UPI001C07C504|nr:FkbM family methyltransferase [Acidithiobacillus ferrooxidans]MBU2856905.1 FkbM family methyltransferase [Acidithiobacillus ferrooxidans]MBU2859926.1 FkbM family methyltransferase [Acidithiobacillus ferrooxidans]MCL4526666.1 FkbM family methyltransferase [Gammaproteobacteria bacterium]
MTTFRPIAFVTASTNHGTMIVNRNDYRIVPGGAFGVGHQILTSSSFDQPEVDLVLQLLSARRTHHGDGVFAIDCGANIGAHTIEWAKLMYGWGSVVAFEAQERIFYALAGNIAINNCFNARAEWAAVGAGNGFIGVPSPDYNLPSSYGSLELKKSASNEFIGQEIDYSEEKAIRTRMVAIDQAISGRVDFIKIDVEGMEIDVLHGARETIIRNKPGMLIEKIKSEENELIGFVTGLGYKTFQFGINIIAIHESDPAISMINTTV